MENHLESIPEILEVKRKMTYGQWLFSLHPRIFLTLPLFLLSIWGAIVSILIIYSDLLRFFTYMPVTWWNVFLIFFFGSFLISIVIAPIVINLISPYFIFLILQEKYSAWNKFFYIILVLLLFGYGPQLSIAFYQWILGL